MAKNYISQNFNGVRKSYLTINADDATVNALIALMPNGQTVLAPTATAASGVSRARPTSYFSCTASCYDSVDGKNHMQFVNLKYGEPTLTNIKVRDILLLTGIETPNGTSADKISISKMKRIGA